MKRWIFNFVLAMSMIFPIALAQAGVPQVINYQGKLTDLGGKAVDDGNYDFTFQFYNQPTGGVAIWSEDQKLAVKNGIFAAELGKVAAFSSFSNVDFTTPYYLEIHYNNEIMSPRRPIDAVPYAFRADKATSADNGVQPGTIIMFNASGCPAGYDQLNFDGKFPRCNSSYGATYNGGSHSHTGSVGSTSIDHQHYVSGETGYTGFIWNGGYGSHGSMDGHAHSVNIWSGGMNQNVSHNHTMAVDAATAPPPPYFDVVFCVKK